MPEPDAVILATLRQARWPRTPAQVAEATGLPPGTVQKRLERLVDQRLVLRPRRGLYGLLTTTED